MRWEELFADVAAELAEQERRDLELEVADRIRAELARVRLVDRLRAAGAEEVALDVGAGQPLRGVVVDCAAEWVLLGPGPGRVRGPAGARRALVPLRAVVTARDVPRHVGAAASVVGDRRSLGSALRALAAVRCPVRVLLRGSDGAGLRGTLDRVGADHVDLREHAPEELPSPGAPVATLPLGALGAVLDLERGAG